MTKIIAVLLPGTTGTNLMLDLVNIWPDTVMAEAAVLKADRLALAMLDNASLTPGTPIQWGTGSGYGNFEQFFTRNFGFVAAAVTSASDVETLPATGERYLLGFGYDWRNDNTVSAAALQATLEQIDTKFGSGTYQTWLIAHSMGGLVARALLEQDTAGKAEAPWYKAIQGLITLATPHLGAPLALEAIAGDIPATGQLAPLVPIIPSFVNGTFTTAIYDSTYELLPPPGQNFIDADATPCDVFNLPADAQQALTNLGESGTYLSDAKTFFGTLSYEGTASLPPYYLVYGLTQTSLTVTGATYTTAGGWSFAASPGTGDGVVPQPSAMFAGRTVPPAGMFNPPGNVTHIELPANADVQNYIAGVMKLGG